MHMEKDEIIRQLKIAAGKKVFGDFRNVFSSPVNEIKDMREMGEINEIIRKYENKEEHLLTPREKELVNTHVKIY